MIDSVWKTFEGWYDDFQRDSIPVYVLVSFIVCLASLIFGLAALDKGVDPSFTHRYVILAPLFVGVSAVTAWLVSLIIDNDDLTTVALSFTYIAAVFVSSSLLSFLLIEVPATMALFLLLPVGIILGAYWLLVKRRK